MNSVSRMPNVNLVGTYSTLDSTELSSVSPGSVLSILKTDNDTHMYNSLHLIAANSVYGYNRLRIYQMRY